MPLGYSNAMTPNQKIQNLIASGWTCAELARKLNVARSTVMRYRDNERRPGYELGSQIMRIRPKVIAA